MGSQPRNITQTTQETKAPLAAQAPYYQTLWDTANAALAQTTNNPFEGNFVTPANPLERLAVQRGTDLVNGGQIGAGAQDFQRMALATARGDMLDPNSNPFINQVASAALRPIQENFTSSVLPGITDRAIADGAYGGARQDLSQERASNDLTRTSGDITSNIFYQNYLNERNNQLNSAGLLNQSYDLFRAPVMEAGRLGETSRALDDLGTQNALQQYQNQQAAPWYGLGDLANVLGSGGFGSSSGTSTAPNPNYRSPFEQILGGLIGGSAAVAGIGGQGGFGLWGQR